MDFNYRLKRAGPRNLNILTSNNIIGKNIPDFNYASIGMRDIYDINLSKIMAIGIQESAQRSNSFWEIIFSKYLTKNLALVFLETFEGSFVLEPSNRPATALFGHYLLKDLQVDVPETRTLCYTSSEMRRML